MVKDYFDRIKYWSVITLIIAISLAVVVFCLLPLFEDPKKDYLFLARVNTVSFFVMAFAILRLYNAVVQNTRFILSIKDACMRTDKSMNNLVQSNNNLKSTIGNTNKALNKIQDSLNKKEETK